MMKRLDFVDEEIDDLDEEIDEVDDELIEGDEEFLMDDEELDEEMKRKNHQSEIAFSRFLYKVLDFFISSV